MGGTSSMRDGLVLLRVAGRACALRVGDVREVMRPQPIEPLAGAPPFVMGLAVVRGEAVPVLDLASLLGAEASAVTRFVTVKAGDRQVALAVGEVIGFSQNLAEGQALPPLAVSAQSALEAVGALDRELLSVLGAARLVPESVWAALGRPA